MQHGHTSSKPLSSTLSFLVLSLTFVTGLLLGFGFASYSNSNSIFSNVQQEQQQQVATPNCHKISGVQPSPLLNSRQNENQQTAEVDEKSAAISFSDQKDTKHSSSTSACHSIAFVPEVGKKSFLEKLADSNAKTSIIKGGTLLLSSLSPLNTNNKDDAKSKRSFREIGDSMKDDKTLSHRFDHGYETYLGHPSVRDNSHLLSIFEVGLGCNQHLGVGASAKLWGEFLPNARLAMLEFDEKCAKEWPQMEENKKVVPKGGFVVYAGDQSSPKTWTEILRQEDENDAKMHQQALDIDGQNNKNSQKQLSPSSKKIMMYDVVIDDGGHTMEQQITTFMTLWPRVKPGGIYVIEDMNTSWKTRYQGTKRMMANSRTTNNLVKALMDRVHSIPTDSASLKSDEDVKKKSPIHRVDCMHFICIISKRWVE